ncbi:MAG: hypothetical protein LBN95_04340 [Prevotellaceae bacterium]|jgi:hypothetical protein|nr:hypothetical protein [Prevotellaceae bacterium]
MRKFVLFATIVAMGLSACQKTELAVDNNLPVKQKATFAPVSSNIRVFNTVDELSEEIDKVLSMPLTDLVKYETSIGFNSFGKLADLAYQEVAANEDSYKSVAEVQAAIQPHSEYLQLLEDETGYTCETKLYNSALKYIVNNEKMYQINDTLAKILDNATIFTLVDNYAELLTIDEGNVVSKKGTKGFDIILKGGGWPDLPDWFYDPSYYPLINHLNDYIYEKDVERINGRDHKLEVEVRMQRLTSNTEEPMCYLHSRRKGIANGVYWWFGRNINYDLTITTTHANYNQQVHDVPYYLRLYVKGTTNNTYDYSESFMNDLTTGTLPYLTGFDNVFVRTRGHASYSPNLYVNFNKN